MVDVQRAATQNASITRFALIAATAAHFGTRRYVSFARRRAGNTQDTWHWYDSVMVLYRRNWLPGGTFFFTVTLADRSSSLLVDRVDVLREATRKTRLAMPFEIVAMVVMPDHLHAVWTLPDGDTNYATRWRLLKTQFTKSLGIASPWQRRYWEHTIRDDRDLANHIDYIHINPLKHGLVERASDWPHSSIHRYIADGVIARDWASTADDLDVGEPVQ